MKLLCFYGRHKWNPPLPEGTPLKMRMHRCERCDQRASNFQIFEQMESSIPKGYWLTAVAFVLIAAVPILTGVLCWMRSW